MTARTVVMPLHALAYVAGDPDIVVRWIGATSNDVDDSFFNAMHARPTGMARANAKSE
jgi:hypothetical protein